MHTPWVIAEAGVNHNGSLEIALELVKLAKEASAGAIKFQSFSAEDLVNPSTGKVSYQQINDPATSSQLEMLSKLQLTRQDFREIFEFGAEIGIDVFSTPYSVEELEFLASLGVSTIKIASADIVDLELIQAAAETGIQTIVSTGMADMVEVERVVSFFPNPESQLILMHATSSYPAPNEDLNMRAVAELKRNFGTKVGYSDHSLGNRASVLAIALGAEVFERHFTFNKQSIGPDHRTSLEPREFRSYIDELEQSVQALGSGIKRVMPSEFEMQTLARKRVVFSRDVSEGQILGRDDLMLRRVGEGVSAAALKNVIGKRLMANRFRLDPVQEEGLR